MEKSLFVNFTNHSSDNWELRQKKAAEKYGVIKDIPYPDVDPNGDREYIIRMADFYVEEIEKLKPAAVLCQGEFCLAYQVISKLKERHITVLAACSKRCVKTEGREKRVLFMFEQFREY